MAASLSQAGWTRSLTSTANKTITPSAEVFAGTNEFIVDIYGTVNSLSKVLTRVRIPTQFAGMQFRTGASFLLFPGNAANYAANGSAPANSAASSTSNTYYSSWLSLDSFYTAAGDTE